MSLINSITNLFAPQITDEQRTEYANQITLFSKELSEKEKEYTSISGETLFTDKWSKLYDNILSVRIPKKDSLFDAAQDFKDQYENLHEIILKQNSEYLDKEAIRADALLSDIDGKSLDKQQRRVVICEEDCNLVLAGAGSGKTLTIAGKVKYLCAEKGVNPEDILLIAFTKKSAEEMTERIANRLSLPVTANTFHKLGLDIITEARGRRPDVLDDLASFVHDYFEKQITKNPKEIKNLIEYFAYYLNLPADMEKFDSLGDAYEYEKSVDFDTVKGKYESAKFIANSTEARKIEKRTLQNERVKSLEEVSIANFLFLNGVKYEYERKYPFESDDPTRKAYAPDFYLPDYDIYIEHFGIAKDGSLPWLTPIEEKKYQEDMEWKREFHEQNGTKLLETYSYYSSEGRLLEELEKMLKQNGVQFKEPDFKDIFDTVYASESDKYFAEFMQLCCTFINLFKSNGYQNEDLARLKSDNPIYQKAFFRKRTELFKSIIQPILQAYDTYLEENGAIDFSDMINAAAKVVVDGFKVHPYKWVIVDEFQDISVARYKLVKAILDQTGAKLLCVGDDWQSIYRFTGSDITLFTDFERYFGKAAIMRLEQTYRNSQQLIDEAGAFVMRNPAQYKKNLRSSKSLDYPLSFMCYRNNPFPVLQRTMNKIIATSGTEASILILGRTNYDVQMLAQSGLFSVKNNGQVTYNASPETPISFMSVHKAKGLEADNVVLLNFQNSTLGFPNKIADDPILELVLTSGDEYLYAEERRLLYVALTRTKNRTFILVDENKPSEFMKEFKSSKSVFILSAEAGNKEEPIPCPHCKTGKLIVRKNEGTNRYFVGCSNYPQCDYTVRDTLVMSNPRYCPECGGFLIKRRGKFGTFYGCTNYPTCGYTEQGDSRNNERNH